MMQGFRSGTVLTNLVRIFTMADENGSLSSNWTPRVSARVFRNLFLDLACLGIRVCASLLSPNQHAMTRQRQHAIHALYVAAALSGKAPRRVCATHSDVCSSTIG